MSVLVFVDANVFIYQYDPREPLKRARAAEWLATLWRDRRGRTSMQVLSECQWNLARKYGISPDEAWDDVSALFEWSPQPVDRAVLEGAREIERRHRLSWWDSLIVAAAQLQNCAMLLTEDLQDGATFGAMRVVNPFLHAVREPAADYLVAQAVSTHRPRGRPRRAYA
jgi:predicted nucleic acid-binding protein